MKNETEKAENREIKMKLPVGYEMFEDFDGIFHVAHQTGQFDEYGSEKCIWISSGATEREAQLNAHKNTLYHDLALDLFKALPQSPENKKANDFIHRIASKL